MSLGFGVDKYPAFEYNCCNYIQGHVALRLQKVVYPSYPASMICSLYMAILQFALDNVFRNIEMNLY